MVIKRFEALTVPAVMVKSVVEALALKVLVPAPRNSTLLKSSAAPVISPESVIPEPLKKTVPALSAKSPELE